MFHLTALAIALHGIGYGSMLTALQGLLAVTSFEPEPPGGLARIAPRRRVRRPVHGSWLVQDDLDRAAQSDDEESLLLIGL